MPCVWKAEKERKNKIYIETNTSEKATTYNNNNNIIYWNNNIFWMENEGSRLTADPAILWL